MVDVSIPRCKALQIHAHLFDLGVADLGSRNRRHLAEPLADDLDEFTQFLLERHQRRALTAAGFGAVTLFTDACVWRLGIVATTPTAVSFRGRFGHAVHTEACHEGPSTQGGHEPYCHWILNASCPCREMLAADG